MRKFLILVLILSILFVCSCSKISYLRYLGDDDNIKGLQYSRIKFIVSEGFIRGGFSDYRDQMIEEFKKLALDKTNTEITFVFTEESVYAETLQIRINSGLEFDVFMGFESIQSDRLLSSMFKSSRYWIEKGVALDLTDYITLKYENLYNRFEKYPILKELASYNGRIYSIPSGIQSSERPYILIREDLRKKYASGKPLETMEDLALFMERVNQDYPDHPFYIKTHFTFYDLIEFFAWEEGYYILPGAYVAKIDDPNITPVPIEDTMIIDRAASFYERVFDIFFELDSSVEVSTILAADKTALFLSKNPEEYHFETAGYHPYEYTFQQLYPDSGYHLKIPGELSLMVYNDSKNKERTLTILNWLGSSNQAYDILSYGLEGVNYVYKDRLFQFNEKTEPALGWMQRFSGFPELEKNFKTDKTPYSEVLENNMQRAYINPFDSLLIKNYGNMNVYLDQTRQDATLYGSRTAIVSHYVRSASRTGKVDSEEFKRELAEQQNENIEQHLKELITVLKNG
mgnify:CR=1 FL=1